MLKNVITLIFFILLNFSACYSNGKTWAQLNSIIKNTKIDFATFPTKNIRERKKCIPVLDTADKKQFRTIITNAAEMEPNFDGKYRVIEFGAGSGVQNFYILDLNSGDVFEGKVSSFGIKYSLNSSMMIINPIENMPYESEEYVPLWLDLEIKYLKWNGNDFTELLAINCR